MITLCALLISFVAGHWLGVRQMEREAEKQIRGLRLAVTGLRADAVMMQETVQRMSKQVRESLQ